MEVGKIMSSIQKKKYNSAKEKEENVIGKRTVEARKIKGVSCSELSRILLEQGTQISSQVINKWENAYAVPTGYQLIALCHALDIEDGLSFFARDYKPDLNTEGMKKVQEYRDLLVASGLYPFKERKMGKIIQMPVSPIRASAGTGNYIDEATFEMIDVNEDVKPWPIVQLWAERIQPRDTIPLRLSLRRTMSRQSTTSFLQSKKTVSSIFR